MEPLTSTTAASAAAAARSGARAVVSSTPLSGRPATGGMRNFGRRVSVAPASWPPAAPRRPREEVRPARRVGVRGRWAPAGPTRGDVPARGVALGVVGGGAEGATAWVTSRCAVTRVVRARGCAEPGRGSGARPPTVAAGFGSGFSGSPAYATRAPVLTTTTAISATNSFRAGTTRATPFPDVCSERY
jgi:hypothetical protein